MIQLPPNEIITPPVRLSYPNLFTPRTRKNAKPGEKPKFDCALLLPPTVDLKPFAAVIEHVQKERWGKTFKLGRPPIKRCSDKDGNMGVGPDWYFMNVSTGYQPIIVDSKRQPVLDPKRVYPGIWALVHLKGIAWNHDEGGNGVSFSLEAIQLYKDDTPLVQQRTAENTPFAVLDDAGMADGAPRAGAANDDPLGLLG